MCALRSVLQYQSLLAREKYRSKSHIDTHTHTHTHKMYDQELDQTNVICTRCMEKFSKKKGRIEQEK